MYSYAPTLLVPRPQASHVVKPMTSALPPPPPGYAASIACVAAAADSHAKPAARPTATADVAADRTADTNHNEQHKQSLPEQALHANAAVIECDADSDVDDDDPPPPPPPPMQKVPPPPPAVASATFNQPPPPPANIPAAYEAARSQPPPPPQPAPTCTDEASPQPPPPPPPASNAALSDHSSPAPPPPPPAPTDEDSTLAALAASVISAGMMCASCSKPIAGMVLELADGRILHPECHCCAGCQQPIANDIMTVNEQPYHAACLVCVACGVNVASSAFAVHPQTGAIYCAVHARQPRPEPTTEPPSPSPSASVSPSPSQTARGSVVDGSSVCSECGHLAVGSGEPLIDAGENRVLHAKCLRCTTCREQLDPSGVYAHGGKFFCEADYRAVWMATKQQQQIAV